MSSFLAPSRYRGVKQDNTLSTKMVYLQCSEAVSESTGVVGQRLWSKKELNSVGLEVKKLKMILVQISNRQCGSSL